MPLVHDFSFSLPIGDPVLIFALILLIVLFSTITLKKFNIPSVIGLILAGTILGPNGFTILERDSSIVLFGTVGLLYIMFMAALEIDIAEFKKNKHKSMLFGFFTFAIPMILGTLAGFFLLGLGWVSAILLASMFASHTLLSYPLASQLGITKNRAVATTVGGTIITDTAALLILAVIAASANGDIDTFFWVQLFTLTLFFGIAVFWGLPRVAYWFFSNYEESVPQYIFVLAMVFLSAFLAKLCHLEPIIGAFMAGLALNRFIPHSSALMNRIEFIGNAVFIPFFLIGVGMIVDVRVFISDVNTILVAFVMTTTALASKWAAAFVMQKLLGYSLAERQVMFGLSVNQAAATLAAVFIGFKLGFFNEAILNGTVAMILITCLVGSFITEKWGQEIAENEADVVSQKDETEAKILVAVEDAEKINELMQLALMIKNGSEQPIYALHVVRESSKADEQVIFSSKMLKQAVELGSATESPVQVISSIAPTVSQGIVRAGRELRTSDTLLAWDGNYDETNKQLFGSVIDAIIKKTSQSLNIVCLSQPLNTIKKITVLMPPRIELEQGFVHTLTNVKQLVKELSAAPSIVGSSLTLRYAEAVMMLKPEIKTTQKRFDDWRNLETFAKECEKDELLIFLAARPGTLSWDEFMDTAPQTLSQKMKDKNFIVSYPTQNTVGELEQQIAENRYKELFGGSRRLVRRAIDKIKTKTKA